MSKPLVNQAQMWQIGYIASLIRKGGVVAYPTEAVWGLGCDPNNEYAVQRILDIKNRPRHKGLILVAGQFSELGLLAQTLTQSEKEALATKYEVPTTWLVPDRENVIPDWIKGEHSKIAVRLIDHPLVAALTKILGHPIVSTSANYAGRKEKYARLPLALAFYQDVDCIMPGEVGGASRPSSIRDLETGTVIRP